MNDWLWHLVNDPVSENPWSLVALVLIVSALFWSMWITGGWRHLPRCRGDRDA